MTIIKLFIIYIILFITTNKIFCQVSSSCLDAFRYTALQVHNDYRLRHGSWLLTVDPNLNSMAQNWAKTLSITNSLSHMPNLVNTGENLYAMYSTVSPGVTQCTQFATKCVKSWYDEIVNYNFNNPGFSFATGHFTQVVWNNSIKIGLGIGIGTYANFNSYYCVAQYQPPGNVNSPAAFRANVFPSGPIVSTRISSVPTSFFSSTTTFSTSSPSTTLAPIRTSFTTSTTSISTSSIPSDGLPSGCLNAFRLAALQAHNLYRSRHSAGPLVEDININTAAQTYAMVLGITNVFAHSTNRVDTGENLYAYYSNAVFDVSSCSQFGTKCVKSWYDEVSSYNYNNPVFSLATGHFTQVVWVNSKKVGFGLSIGKSNGYNSFYCVGQYQPAGNYQGQFAKNVLPAQS